MSKVIRDFGKRQIPVTGSFKMSSSNSNGSPDLENSLTRTVLKLEEIDRNLYRGTHLWKPVGGRAVFGGQVVGQALTAAGLTKPTSVHLHSMHCYFVRPGDPKRPILYHIERVRDGRSFSTRNIEAIQNGNVILTMQASYQAHEPSVLEHQYTMPEVPPPESLADTEHLLRGFLRMDSVSEARKTYINKVLAQDVPIEIRPVDPEIYYRLEKKEPRLLTWVRAKGRIGEDNDLHRCVAAYLSDMSLLRATLIPEPRFRPTMMASLDHAMWFHSHFRADEWMLYEVESTKAGGARGLALGRLWSRDGTLAVSVAQEGVIRGVLNPKSNL